MSGTQFLQVPCGLGAKNGDMDNICELLVNVVISDKRKGTGTLEPKGKGYGLGWSVFILHSLRFPRQIGRS